MTATCSTCAHWTADLPPLATALCRPRGADDDLGICQLHPPQIVRAGGLWASLFPEVHADRNCGEWAPGMPVDDGDDGEEADAEEAGDNIVPFGRAAA